MGRLGWAGVAATILTAASLLPIVGFTLVPGIIGLPGTLVGLGMVKIFPGLEMVATLFVAFCANVAAWTALFYVIATMIAKTRRPREAA